MNHIVLISILAIFYALISPNVKAYVHHQGKHINTRCVLPDVIHNTFKNHQIYGQIADLLMIVAIAGCIIYLTWHHQWMYLQYYAILFLGSYLVMMVFFVSTVLPDSKQGQCKYTSHFFKSLSNMGSCNNLGISGHLIIIGISLFIVSLFQNHKYAYYYIVYYVIATYFVIASRNHYSIDALTSSLFLLLIIAKNEFIMKSLHLTV